MKLFYFVLIITLFFSGKVLSQSVSDTTSANDNDLIFTVVEHPAQFPGGMSELYNYLVRELQYPKDARKDGISGKVYVQFVINKDGSVDKESIVILKSLYPSLDDEAIRLVKLMPNWKPGTQNGKPVKSKFVLPLTFNSASK